MIMLKQTITIRNPASLRLRDNQLVIELAGGKGIATRPIEDIAVLVIENQMVKMSIPLLNHLVDHNVAVVLCDGKSMPHSMLMSLDGNSTLQEAYRHQLAATVPAKKQVWKQLVESKIANQSRLLCKLGRDGALLKPHCCNVKSGDSDNREGAAARLYWPMLLGADFVRMRTGEPPNNLLNYGYTILRAAVARALIGSGLYPAFGVFHRNRYNAFPLADDVMEPYRPFVDEIVLHMAEQGFLELDPDNKTMLQRVLFADVIVGKVMRPLEVALTITSASLLKFYKGEVKALSLPVLK